jgi:hypothetical protein
MLPRAFGDELLRFIKPARSALVVPELAQQHRFIPLPDETQI